MQHFSNNLISTSSIGVTIINYTLNESHFLGYTILNLTIKNISLIQAVLAKHFEELPEACKSSDIASPLSTADWLARLQKLENENNALQEYVMHIQCT